MLSDLLKDIAALASICLFLAAAILWMGAL